MCSVVNATRRVFAARAPTVATRSPLQGSATRVLQRWVAAGAATEPTAGRRSRGAGKPAPPSADVPTLQPLTTSSQPPPGLRRLTLSAAELEAVLALANNRGPQAAYEKLVEGGALEADSAQSRSAEALQRLWYALRQHREAKVLWQVEHARWVEDHGRWRENHEIWQARAKVAAGSEQSSPQDMPEPLEPVEPQAPALASHGCYLWGGVGAGKSLLMDLFVESCGAESGIEQPARRVHFHEFMYSVHQELHRLRQVGVEKTTRTVAQGIAQETKLLAFDEFQITNISDALIVETLFSSLFAEGLTVIMTSNRPPHDLYKDGLNRHLAIPQFLALLDHRGIDLREIAAARDFRATPELAAGQSIPAAARPSAHHSRWRDFYCKGAATEDGAAGADTIAEVFLAEAFSAAAVHDASSGQTRVPIAWGRTMEIVESAGGVGRFTFGQLCEEALNADDYLILAKRFHTLIVADVPQLSLEQHNEARRFTNLVDCAYEHHARLVMSAEVPPDQLLSSMDVLAGLSLKGAEIEGFESGSTVAGSSDWIRYNQFSPQASTVTEAVRQAAAGPNDAAPGNDEQSTGSGVAGVMAGALGSLQESGFAARRATSRMLHMQTDEYLIAHQKHRLQVE